MSIENGISILLHSSGVLCVLKGYAASLKQTLKIVQSLVSIAHFAEKVTSNLFMENQMFCIDTEKL